MPVLRIHIAQRDDDIDPDGALGQELSDELSMATASREDTVLGDQSPYFVGEERTLLIVHTYDDEGEPFRVGIMFVQKSCLS